MTMTRLPRCSHRAYHTGKVGDVAPQIQGKGAELLFKYERPSACAACEREHGPCYDPAPTLSASIDVGLALKQDPDFDPTLMDASGAFLRVEYGSGIAGVKHTVDVDLVNGVSLPIIAESANFYIVYPSTDSEIQPTLRVAISVGEFSFGSTGPRAPQRTIPVGKLTNGELGWTSGLVEIPKYAVAASLQTADVVATVKFDQYGNVAGAPATLLAHNDLVKPEYSSVRIVQGARAFVITAVTKATNPNVIFYLAPA